MQQTCTNSSVPSVTLRASVSFWTETRQPPAGRTFDHFRTRAAFRPRPPLVEGMTVSVCGRALSACSPTRAVKASRWLVGSMTELVAPIHVVGKLQGARGACPVCGTDVARTHAFNGARLLDRYGCFRCGVTEYVVMAA